MYLDFPMQLINWIMEIVTTPAYSILLNGEVEGFFKGARGLRQGDPISPFLFVLIMEIFTRRLQAAAKNRGFSYHPRCKRLKLTSLCFADDLLLFCKPTLPTLRIIDKVIKDFAVDSGLIVNCQKSRVYFSGLDRKSVV